MSPWLWQNCRKSGYRNGHRCPAYSVNGANFRRTPAIWAWLTRHGALTCWRQTFLTIDAYGRSTGDSVEWTERRRDWRIRTPRCGLWGSGDWDRNCYRMCLWVAGQEGAQDCHFDPSRSEEHTSE